MIKKSCLCPPADMEGRKDMGLRPIHNLRKFLPVFHLGEVHLFYRRTGDDHAVIILLLNIPKLYIKRIKMRRTGMCRLMTGDFHKCNFRLYRKVRKYTKKIQLRVLFQRHKIQNQNLERTNVLGDRTVLIHHKDIFRFQNMLCR